jgi:hypothetical protein
VSIHRNIEIDVMTGIDSMWTVPKIQSGMRGEDPAGGALFRVPH